MGLHKKINAREHTRTFVESGLQEITKLSRIMFYIDKLKFFDTREQIKHECFM